MPLKQQKTVVFAILALAFGEFALDLNSPLSVPDWVNYFIILLLSVYAGSWLLPYLLAGAFSVMMLVGFYFSPSGEDPHLSLTHHEIGIGALWLMAVLISQRNRMEANLRRTERTLRTIGACGQSLVWAKTEPALLQEVCQAIVKEGGYRLAWVCFAEPDEQKSVSIAAQAGHDEGYLKELNLTWADRERGRGPTGTAIRSGQPVLCGSIATDPNFAPWSDAALKHGYVSTLALPLLEGNRAFGVLSIYAAKPNAFSAEEADLLAKLADDLAYGILALRRNLEQSKAEKAARESEENLNRAQAVAHVGSWHVDIRNDALTWSAETYRMFGIQPEQPLTLESFFARVHPADRDDVRQAWNAALQGARYDIEHRIVLGSETRWVRERAEISFDAQGNALEGIGTVQDITERKHAESQISEQARLLELAHDAIVVRDMEDRVLYWNQSAERIFGWQTREAIGRKMNELLPKDEFNALKYEEAKKIVLDTGNWQGEFATQTKTGKGVLLETRWTLVCDEEGTHKSILGINTDITEKKRFEIQFLRAQRMESIGTLAGGIAHDLNNILTPLLVSVRLLKEKIGDDADGKRMLAALEANVQRGAKLVKQVLTFGRGAQGARAPINPKHIASEIKQIIAETFPKSVEFELNCPANLWTIIGDPTQLHQVLLNLCVNARDAMPNGGKLSLKMENMMVDETNAGMNLEAKPGPYLVITVMDTGVGMPKEIQDKIFDPFFTTKEPGKGTGLGLSTALAIVASHNGFIVCKSEEGKGTAFNVYFPADRASVELEQSTEVNSHMPQGRNELILVVDDEDPILNLAQKLLTRSGYRVLLAGNGVEAVSLYTRRRSEIDLVLTDMVMPLMDGPATINALKSFNPNIKIIGSSGMVSENGLAKAKEAGILHFIPKPYTAETLLGTIREVLQENGPYKNNH
jgi:PAS domain S-box-containing protein